MKNALINGDSLDILKKFPDNSFDSMVTDPPAGIAFMGKKWDKNKGGRDLWISWLETIMVEAFRTLKPGAHILVWAMPRTSHWTATAVENSGFEIKDVVTHIFGSGFPKSHNVAKAMDKAAGVEPLARVPAGGVGMMNKARGTGGRAHKREDGGWNETKVQLVMPPPTTEEAKQWDGWGTALKPATQYWILARKPLSEKTIAANVLEHGTGGINIDASRIGTQGRFPANLILSHKPGCELKECEGECATKRLDEQSIASGLKEGASRYFYCAKASKKEKTLNKTIKNEHPTVKSLTLMKYLINLITPPGGVVLDPFMGSGTTGQAALEDDFGFVGVELEINSYDIAKKRIPSINNLICAENA